jgi:Chaperone of endosialidase
MKTTHSAFLALVAALVLVPALAQATALSDLTAATATNAIDSGSNEQLWKWNSLSNNAIGLWLTSNSSAITGSGTLLNVQLTNPNSNSGVTSIAANVANDKSGTNSTNYGVAAEASGATHNYAVHGSTPSVNAGDASVWGESTGSSGANYGVYGTNASATGYAGYFNNSNGGYAAAFMGGKVGIGTATPINLLDIGTSGGIHIASGVPVGTSMALYNNSGTLMWNGIALATGSSVSGTTNYIPVFTGASTLGNSVIYQNGSNVGIGTATPQSLVHAYGGEVQVGSSSASCATANNGAIRFSGSSLYFCAGTTWTSVGGSSQWTTSGSNIDYTAGNVGIGTSTPAQTLQVHPGTDQTLQIAGHASAASGTTIRSIKDDYSVWEPLELVASTTVLGVAGNVGVNTTSPSYTLQVNGSVAGTSAYVNTSDARYKKNVKPLQSGLNEIAQLKPVTFEWKDEVLHPENVLTSAKSGAGVAKSRPRTMDSSMQGQQIGFVAQDVEKILPSVVVTEDNAEKTKGMKYSEIIPVLVKAVQEQQAEIDDLKKTNAAMKSKLGM